MSRWAVVAALALSLSARAQRPDEDALFGGAPDAGAAGARPSEESMFGGSPDGGSSAGAARAAGGGQESGGLDVTPSSDAFAAGRVQEDPLKIGGLFYTRAFLQVSQDQPFGESRVSLPTLVDGYLDARPTERLRAFVLGRLTYDPFLSTTVGGTALPGIPASTSASNPAVLLDQAWLAFDIARSVFVTAGRQHVKWGVARFFSPTDFLASQPRDPLALFDARLGVTMVRAQIPWERAGWNFTAAALFEPTQNVGGGYSGSSSVENPGGSGINPTGTTGTTLQDVGGAARAEFSFKNGAFGLDGLVQRNRAARAGADVTMSLGDFDVYGEVAWKEYSDAAFQRSFTVTTQVDPSEIPGIPPGTLPPGTIPVTSQAQVTIAERGRPVVQAAGGATYSINFEGNKSITLGAEYFFNSASYSRDEYLGLLIIGGFQPFYVGKHYLALSATLLDTTAKTTWILSGIGNLSDSSYIARLDFVVTVLSYLSVESYIAGHFGRTGGELRLGFPRTDLSTVPGVSGVPPGTFFGPLNAPILDLGVGLRLSM
ncbi:MAG TPA: hypothetical protein VMT11_08245 [Myxococcaceae bacterium]|nr:hypothetical protein [Myxococcaceae bacterium]